MEDAVGGEVVGLKYGLEARIVDLPPETVLRASEGMDRTARCPLTRLAAWSCRCWRCQGLLTPRWTYRPGESDYTPPVPPGGGYDPPARRGA